ncbi:acyl carrier protein [Geodermatophilus sp. SYSU D00708]
MTRHDVEARVNHVLSLVLKLPSPPEAPLVRTEVPEWDSLSHIEIIYAVEESLGITFSEEEMAALDGSAAIVTAAERHLAA